MNVNLRSTPGQTAPGESPILVISYAWIGDFVRCHSVVKLLRSRWPRRPVDMLSTTLCAPLVDYMPGVRKGIVCDLPRGRLALGRQKALAEQMRREGYGTALITLRTWKSALAPFLAGIPERVGFVGEARFGLVNDLRWGERHLPRMIDHFGTLALPKGAPLPSEWPLPELVVPPAELAEWRSRRGLSADGRPVVTLAPGAVGRGKAWHVAHYAELARTLAADAIHVWVLGGPQETALAAQIAASGGPRVRDITGNDLRNAILALAAADVAVSNDSGLMHIAAALDTPTIAIFGPTSPWHWGPLNPLAATIEPASDLACPRCGKLGCNNVHHRRTADIPATQVLDAVRRVLAARAGR
jgi:heptosyltransferase-2